MASMKLWNKKEKNWKEESKKGKENRRNEEREGRNKEEEGFWFMLCKSLEVSITQATEQNPHDCFMLCNSIITKYNPLKEELKTKMSS